ncbi:TPA: hypothetical protein ACYSBI_000999 [Morganella morganii]
MHTAARLFRQPGNPLTGTEKTVSGGAGKQTTKVQQCHKHEQS